ncbi:MAG TPA: acyl-CoA dehydrogenase [Casimicrobiaceae bacterium]|nr:acyl-CoA dehydrogenase [Casimicrobiaceae bacterium]
MLTVIWLLAVLVGAVALAYVNASGRVVTAAIAVALAVAWGAHALPGWLSLLVTIAFVILAIPLNVPTLRRKLISDAVLGIFRKVMPSMSQTERDAIEAGTVWWDGDLFSGRPDWERLLAIAPPTLTAEEQHFLDHDVEELCAMVTDWETTNVYRDLPPRVWQFIKDRGFLGMAIAKEYGGLGFSAYAHSQVMTKLSTHSGTVSVTVMVPNSLGPGELLAHYGTEQQKRHYLPRLAKGIEIPCFALTNPVAGSDAASIPDYGVVCWGEHEGKRVLGLRVTWEKRYITLGPVATLLGLAFRVYDPEHLIGDREDIGITCALIPTTHPGVVIGRRHMPLNCVFQNGPNSGRDVFVPMDWVIGGQPMLGRGWRMLMESLAAGRGISLPASATGMAKLAVRAVGGYARVRQQFKTPIGRFEGIEEALTRMGGNLYMMDATRVLTATAVDLKQKPAVISGITKLHLTERGRQVVIDGMDIVGGKGICMGPSNFLGAAYMQLPVMITVEGANILTRSLIAFGQGAIRCHPYVLKEIEATREADPEKASITFDDALFSHLRFMLSNFARTLVMGLTGAHFVRVPKGVAPETRRYYQQLTRFSAAFALLADLAMGTLGGTLKRKEKISARLGDILSLMYLCSATLKRYENDGRQHGDAPLMHWAIWDAMFKAQNAFEGVISNFPNRIVAALMSVAAFPLGRPYVVPPDRLGQRAARLLIEPSPCRDRLTSPIYMADSDEDPLAQVERALAAVVAAEPAEHKLRSATKSGRLDAKQDPGAGFDALVARAQAAGVITAEEADAMIAAHDLTARVIRVDDFAQDLGAAEMRLASLDALATELAAVSESPKPRQRAAASA